MSPSAVDASEASDPFTNTLVLSKLDLLRLAVGTIVLLPWRAISVGVILVASWVVAEVGLFEATRESLRHGWRKNLRRLYSYLGLLVFWCAGFRVTLKGRQASRKEAPILVGAPHSSFLEALIVIMCRSSPVSRHENRDAFLISACQKFYETIFVDRRKPESRSSAAQEICDRSHSEEDWDQVFLFPEGTNTNRKKLIQFKRGAFNPGVPVQPVLIRYAGYDRLDSITWTFRQDHSYLFSVWLLLANPINRVEIEFMPVYVPNEKERQDPELFAKNVQCLMANKLELFPSDVTYYKYYEEHCNRQNSIK